MSPAASASIGVEATPSVSRISDRRSSVNWERRRQLVEALVSAAPTGIRNLDPSTIARLRAVTAELIRVTPDSIGACERFEQQRVRALPVSKACLREGVDGRPVLVTGGTGCIGTALLSHLIDLSPGRLICVSRGITRPRHVLPDVEYFRADIRDRPAMDAVFAKSAPTAVFHLAAQRNPGLAESTVVESLMTNVVGTKNVLHAAETHGVQRFIYASTGKALRPYTPHIYAASKKLGELLSVASAWRNGSARYCVARFTHVVDNSLVLQRFRAAVRAEPLALHDTSTMFYTQSALEAAQLLMYANGTLGSAARCELLAIRNLGLPTQLLVLALGVVAEADLAGAIHVRGVEPGYEESYYPGLYDPETAADISPLLNAFEAAHVRSFTHAGIDASEISIGDPERMAAPLAELEAVCGSRPSEARARAALHDVSIELLDATLDAVESPLLRRLADLTAPWRASMSEVDLLVDDRIRMRAARSAAI
jgi:FlaA1/EpsC-like NDP-sugar epimerase